MSWKQGRAYSQDFRDKVMAAFDAGEPARDVAERFTVSVSFIYKADLRRRRTGDTAPGRQWCSLPLRLEAHRDAILAEVARRPDVTGAELRAWLEAEQGVRVCVATVWKTLTRFGLTFKKSRSGQRSRTAPTLPPHARPGVRPSPACAPNA